MERKLGTVARGLRAPIVREGDDLEQMLIDTVLGAQDAGAFQISDGDVLAVTETVLARTQGNYAGVDHIAADIRKKTGGKTLGVIFPILSRNRFAICLRGIARGAEKIVLMLSYPSDEVGNHLISLAELDEKGVNPYSETLTEAAFKETFGTTKHTFTGVDYVAYYKSLIQGEGAEAEIVFSNNPRTILDYTKHVLTCDIHSRARTKRILRDAGAVQVLGLDDILTESVSGSGYHATYGLLGANKASEDRVKLFPRDCAAFVQRVQDVLKEKTGKTVEVMVYGDGAFKDPVGGIWELADPVVSPGYTKGLEGTPKEVKLKYLADEEFGHLRGDALQQAITAYIKNKGDNPMDAMAAQGTTPRRLSDLVGSLCDLVSGSGDKGTPFVYVQGYFDNYTE